MPSPGLSGIHADAAGDAAFVDDRGVNSSTQSGRSASAHQEAVVEAEVSFLSSAVVCPRFLWAEEDDGHPPSHPAIVLKTSQDTIVPHERRKCNAWRPWGDLVIGDRFDSMDSMLPAFGTIDDSTHSTHRHPADLFASALRFSSSALQLFSLFTFHTRNGRCSVAPHQ